MATNAELPDTNKGLEANLSEFDEFRKATLESFKQPEEKVENRTLEGNDCHKDSARETPKKWTDTMLVKHVAIAYNLEFKHTYGMFEYI